MKKIYTPSRKAGKRNAMSRIIIPPRKVKTVMNGTEARYAAFLEGMKKAGEIISYQFEAMHFVLVHNVPGRRNAMIYKPDFMVVRPGGMEFHEVKGHWRDDARAKIKMAAELFPWFVWIAVQWKKRQWVKEEF